MVMIWEFVSSVSACLHIYVMYILCCIDIIFHTSAGKTSVSLVSPAPSDDSGDANDGNQLPPGELTSKKRGRSSKVDNMSHGLSDALARYLNDVTAGSEARRAGCEDVVSGRLAETK
jgi:hypothetical protein